jgi:hypothetical protein
MYIIWILKRKVKVKEIVGRKQSEGGARKR